MRGVIVRNKVKVIRIENGEFTQSEFAKKVGVTRQTMNLIEAQKYNPTIKLCLIIGQYLDTPLDELFWIAD